MNARDVSPRDRDGLAHFLRSVVGRRRLAALSTVCGGIDPDASEDPGDVTVPSVVRSDLPRLVRVHPGAITQASMQRDGRTLSMQVRHRRHETVATVAMTETDDAVEIEVDVGTPARDDNQEYVSFGVRFSTVEARLDRPL